MIEIDSIRYTYLPKRIKSYIKDIVLFWFVSRLRLCVSFLCWKKKKLKLRNYEIKEKQNNRENMGCDFNQLVIRIKKKKFLNQDAVDVGIVCD